MKVKAIGEGEGHSSTTANFNSSKIISSLTAPSQYRNTFFDPTARQYHPVHGYNLSAPPQ